jgi:hypothetical protein
MTLTGVGVIIILAWVILSMVCVVMIEGYIEKRLEEGCAMLVSIVIFVAINIIPVYFFSPNDYKYEFDYKYNIYSLEDNMKIKGSRYYFEQDMRYYYLCNYKTGKKMYSVNKNNSYIVESDNDKPHIEVFKRILNKDNWVSNLLLESNSRYNEYKIVVPKRTVTDKFNIDMKN